MFAKLQLELETAEKEKIPYQKASILQSILMEKINQTYAEKLHETGLHPYSQNVFCQNEKNIWNIYTLNKEAYEQIMEPFMEETFQEFQIEHNQWNVFIKNKNLQIMPKHELINQFYFEDGERYIKLQFQTPTAFKRQGNYEFYPDLQLIYQSLMNKYDTVSVDDMVKSDELLEQLSEYSKITQYNLRSCYFPIGRVKIPAFMGTITIKITGPQAMVNFANMLFQFGTYSGVGIKTAMGMGSIERMKV